MKYITITFIILCNIHLTGQNNDCTNAQWLCDQSMIQIKNLKGPGQNRTEVRQVSCYSRAFSENNSHWFKWKIKEPGWIAFKLVPEHKREDLDFVLFRESGLGKNCSNLEEMRCMVSGENLGTHDTYTSHPCYGSTGLAVDASDMSERDGCYDLDDNFASAVYAKKGEVYVLFVNNCTSSKGFDLVHNGTAVFESIENDVSIEVNEDREICLYNQVNFPEDAIEEMTWTLSTGDSYRGSGPHCITLSLSTNELSVLVETRLVSGCSTADEFSFTDLFDIEADALLSEIYPNPTSGLAYLSMDIDADEKYNVRITDKAGRVVFSESDVTGSVYEIQCADFASGIYTLKAYLSGRETLLAERFEKVRSR